MEQSSTGPPHAMHVCTPLQAADGDVETITRKRARVARKKFKIVASTVLACSRLSSRKKFSYVLEVDADDSEEPEQALAALFSSARLDGSSSDELVVGQGHCTTYPEAEGETIALPHGENSFLSNPNQSYYATKQQERSDPFHQAVGEMFTQPNAPAGFLYAPNQGHYTIQGEETGQFEQAVGEMFTLPNAAAGFLHAPNQGHYTIQGEETGQFEQAVGEMFTLPNAAAGFLYAPNQGHYKIQGEETGQFEQRIQEVQKVLDEPDTPCEGLDNRPPLESVWRLLGHLLEVNKKSRNWSNLESDLKDAVTKKIEDLQLGSDRAKVHKLVEDVEEIKKKFENPRSISEGKKLPIFKEVERSLSDALDKLQAHFDEVRNGLPVRQNLTSLAAMCRLIENSRKAVRNLRQETDSVAAKLKAHQRNLSYRGLTVDKHFQKCAESIPALVQSVLQNQRGNFVSVASITDWYFEEKSSLQNAKDPSSSSPSFDAFPLAFDGETFS